MRKFWKISLLMVAGLATLFMGPPMIGQAKELAATGLDAASAVIKNSRGKVMTHTEVLPEDQAYTVNYKWRLPSYTPLEAGDTMTVTVPANVKIPKDDSFEMTNLYGSAPIGHFFIAAGSHTGTVTLNKLNSNSFNRHGFIRLDVVGAGPITEPEEPGTTEPGVTEPTEPEEPGTTEPGVTEPTEPEEPGTTEPGVTEPTEPEEPGTTEPGVTEPTNPEEPGTTEPGVTEPTNPEEPGTTEPGVTEPTNPEEPGTTEPGGAGVMPGEPGTPTEPQEPGELIPGGGDGAGGFEPGPGTTTPTEPGTTPGGAGATPTEPSTTEPGTTEPSTTTPGGAGATPSEPSTAESGTTAPVTGTTPSNQMPATAGQGAMPANGTTANGSTATSGSTESGTTGAAAQPSYDASGHHVTAATLPQTNEKHSPVAAVIGLVALVGLGLVPLKRFF
ncbi:Ig-like domain-containing protein [Levilactobacillus zymae]|uniref:LPXTG cell wall anchor domain-containing protein n=1 Tax=Levilactobacillus zymae TaxID=267363 RepID=UPI0028BB5497|nr:Ig-like domain-containing protein [Levilactobacillus zymae]MDT6981326.1 Ig-like domain-containing protein [Levilactobacillus zymae]